MSTVAIVRRVGENDIEELPDMRMPYEEALAEMRALPRKYRHQFDLVYVQDDGTLGRFASWAV